MPVPCVAASWPQPFQAQKLFLLLEGVHPAHRTPIALPPSQPCQSHPEPQWVIAARWGEGRQFRSRGLLTIQEPRDVGKWAGLRGCCPPGAPQGSARHGGLWWSCPRSAASWLCKPGEKISLREPRPPAP